ncbi:MAG: hypothetical protein SF172_04710 [Burkholderiales bacterium]|nr:hypothetical protein [Burkholderiales bacterium]
MRLPHHAPLRALRDAPTGTRLDIGLIVKLLALLVCFALAAEADAGERSAMRLVASGTATGPSPESPAIESSARSAPPPSTRYGEPQVLSALGEPLDVRIPLLDDDAAIAAEARYSLGHADTRLGLPIVRNANIRVVKDAGGWALRVKSAIINDEPALALVIQEKLASGTLSRALPLLFDPAAGAPPVEPAPQLAALQPIPAQPATVATLAAPAATVVASGPTVRLRPAFLARATARPPARVKAAARRPPAAPADERTTPLRLATTLGTVASPAAAHRESMRWLRRALLEDDDRASLLAMGRKVSQLVAQVEEMEARIASLQPPDATRTASTAGSAAQQTTRHSRRPG